MSIPVTGISAISPQNGWTTLSSLDAGLQLSASVTPSNATNKSIIWSSGTPGVLTINSSTGAILTKAYGTTLITATTADGQFSSSLYFRVIKDEPFVGMNGIICTTAVGSPSMPKRTSLAIGQTKVLFTEVMPNYILDSSYTWQSSNTSIVSINVSQGVYCSITGVANGTATITATRGMSTVSYDVHVGTSIINATGMTPITIQLNRENFTGLYQGLEAYSDVLPSTVSNPSFIWSSSDSSIISITSSGNIVSQGFGTATLTATSVDGGFTATKTMSVLGGPVTGISSISGSSAVTVGSTIALSSSVVPSYAGNQTITWSSSATGVATVNSSGVVSGVSAGTATITATTADGGFTATKSITVNSLVISVTGISSISGSSTVSIGSTTTFSASVTPGNATNQTITWSSGTPGVATVNSSGVVTSVATGVATITATTADGSYIATKSITVTKPVTAISDISGGSSVAVGSTITLSASVSPADATNQTITWSSSATGVATVGASTGVVTGVASGIATITATTADGSYTATKAVAVIVPVTGVSAVSGSSSLIAGATTTLSASVTPANATNQTITWSSSDTAIATVDASGVVTGVGSGTATITATTADGGFTATKSMSVTVNVTGISSISGASTVPIGTTITLSASVVPANATNQTITWSSSNTSIISVNSSTGVVTGVSSGTATITARTASGNFTVTRSITVTVPVSGISPVTFQLGWRRLPNINDGLNAIASATPVNSTNKALIWTSSNVSVITINSSTGAMIARGFGSTIVSATTVDGGYSNSAIFYVGAAVTGISAISGASVVNSGSTTTFSASVTPANAAIKIINWSSSNTAIATVDASGVVTGVSDGTATITASSDEGNYTATKTITVETNTSVTGISAISGASSVRIGSTISLSSSVTPANATNPTITWSSSDTAVATVDSSTGVVTGIVPGTVTITATTANGGYTATKSIIVEKPVTGISAISGSSSVSTGATITLSASVVPYDATVQTITWSSSDTAVATVNSSTGVVTGVSAGTATITGTTVDGSFTSTQSVAVYIGVTGISSISGSSSVVGGSTLTLSASVTPVNATTQTITWSSSNTTVATVDASGVVTGVNAGTATITATTSDGSYTATKTITVTVPVTGISSISGASTMGTGTTLTLGASVTPANATNQAITWSSSNTAVATVNSNTGVVTSLTIGTTTITATTASGGYTATTIITVSNDVRGISAVTFQAGLRRLTNINDGLQAYATVVPSNATNKSITWTSSDPSKILINSTGMIGSTSYASFVAKGVGSAILTATSVEGGYSSSNIFYSGPAVTGISAISGDSVVDGGATLPLSASVTPSNAPIKIINWTSSNTAVATVNPLTGAVVGVSAGTATITATTDEGSFTATKSITVTSAVAVLGITSISGDSSVLVGATISLSSSVTPVNATNQTINWSSSNTAVATVDASGAVTGVGAGTATITATTASGNYTATKSVTVTVPVSGISSIAGSSTIAVGSTESLSASVTPGNATNQTITWSSDATSIATVNSSGVVTAVAVGTATITARTSDGNYTATKSVSVVRPVTGIQSVTFQLGRVKLPNIGDGLMAYSGVVPFNASNTALTWTSSNTSVITINSSTGFMIASGLGSTTITATTVDGEFSSSATFYVGPDVTGISAVSGESSMFIGSTISLSAAVTPSNAPINGISWSSDASGVATVDASGVVTGVSAGSATITATTVSGSFSATKTVTVIPVIAVTGLEDITGGSATLQQGATMQLATAFIPSDANNSSITWSSSNTSRATVSSSGLVTAANMGEVTITAATTTGGYSKTYTLTVTAGTPVSGLATSPLLSEENSENLSVIDGATYINTSVNIYNSQPYGTFSLGIVATPEGAYDKSLTYTVADPSILSVTASGELIPLVNFSLPSMSYNTTTVTVTSASNPSVSSVYNIRVQNANTTGAEIRSSTGQPYLTLQSGPTPFLTYWGIASNTQETNESGFGQHISWISSDPSIATITTGTGSPIVTGVSAGDVYIIAQRSNYADRFLLRVRNSTTFVSVSSVSGPFQTIITTGDVLTDYTGDETYPYQTRVRTLKSVNLYSFSPSNATDQVVEATLSRDDILAIDASGTLSAIQTPGVAINTTDYTNVTTNVYSLDTTITNSHQIRLELNNTEYSMFVDGSNLQNSYNITDTPTLNFLTAAGGETSAGQDPWSGGASSVFGQYGYTAADVTWTSSNPAVATVSKTMSGDGSSFENAHATLQPVSAGTVWIRCAVGQYYADRQFTITAAGVVNVTGITDISGEAATLEIDSTMQLSASVTPANATDQIINWSSSDTSKATVNSSGLLTGVAAGEVTVTATTNSGSFISSVTLTVVIPPITALSITSITSAADSAVLDPTNIILGDVTGFYLNYTTTPLGFSYGTTITSSNEAVVYNDKGGSTFGVIGVGSATITVTSSDDATKYDTLQVTVKAPLIPVTGISSISAADSLTYVAPGSTLALSASIVPANASNQAISWSSSNTSLATVNSSGVVTGVALGNVTITATAAGNSAFSSTYSLRIGVPVSGINDISGASSVIKGRTLQLISGVSPSNASVTGITWSSSDTAVATVNSSTGLVTAVDGGETTITATTVEGSYSTTRTLTVIVLPQELSGISDPGDNIDNIRVPVGGSVQFSGVFVPANTTNKAMTWQSYHTQFATVDASGIVTGVARGVAGVVGRSSQNTNLQRTATVTVYVPVTGMNPITHNGTSDEIQLGTSLQLSCEGVIPSNADNTRYIWTTSHPDHIAVSRTRLLVISSTMPDSIFTVTATSEDGSFTATKTFTIYRPIAAVNPITAPNRSIAVALNNTLQLTLPIIPSNATTQNVTWTSSNPAKVSVSSTGLCTGAGLTIKKEVITLTASIREPTTNTTFTRTYPVTVPINKITGLNAITVVGAPTSLINGQTYQLETAIAPTTASYASLGYTWLSANTAIGTISSSGLLTIVGPGKSLKITAIAVGEGAKKKVSRTFPVITLPSSIQTPIATSTGGYIVARGKKLSLKPVVLPTTSTNKKMSYASSDETIATVTATGVISGLKVGSVTITITSLALGSVSQTVTISVF
jgi:uncharacterized protein YjdB